MLTFRIFNESNISEKMTCMGLLLLKLRTIELESRTESIILIANWKIGKTAIDMVLDSYLQEIASGQVASF